MTAKRCNMTLAYIKALLTFDGFKPKFHSLPKNAVLSWAAQFIIVKSLVKVKNAK